MKLGTTGFFSNRIFPTEGLGDPKAGWHYVYPVHEVSLVHPAAWQCLRHTLFPSQLGETHSDGSLWSHERLLAWGIWRTWSQRSGWSV